MDSAYVSNSWTEIAALAEFVGCLQIGIASMGGGGLNAAHPRSEL